jgi:hypothetical protein
MRIFEQRIPDIVARLVFQPLAFAERQDCLAMHLPRSLEATAGVAALAQREPDAVLDGLEVRGLTDPGLARGRAADDVDARNGLPVLVGGDRCFPVDGHGEGALLRNAGA